MACFFARRGVLLTVSLVGTVFVDWAVEWVDGPRTGERWLIMLVEGCVSSKFVPGASDRSLVFAIVTGVVVNRTGLCSMKSRSPFHLGASPVEGHCPSCRPLQMYRSGYPCMRGERKHCLGLIENGLDESTGPQQTWSV